jgi:hypothetical protein
MHIDLPLQGFVVEHSVEGIPAAMLYPASGDSAWVVSRIPRYHTLAMITLSTVLSPYRDDLIVTIHSISKERKIMPTPSAHRGSKQACSRAR